MGLMKHREGNQVKWVGVRPGHRGTQFYADGLCSNDTIEIYTPSGTKTGYITFINVFATGSVTGNIVSLSLRNAGDDIQANIVRIPFKLAGNLGGFGTFNPPFEVPNGWDIVLISPGTNYEIDAFISGWEE